MHGRSSEDRNRPGVSMWGFLRAVLGEAGSELSADKLKTVHLTAEIPELDGDSPPGHFPHVEADLQERAAFSWAQAIALFQRPRWWAS